MPHYSHKNKRKCRIGSNLHQANTTRYISTYRVLQPAIEANCKLATTNIL